MHSISRTPSVYQIRHIESGKVYVGSAVNPRNRYREHVRRLRGGNHHSRYLQRAWDKYGECAFIFEIIEPVLFVEDLLLREQHWIDTLRASDPAYGYNTSPTAGSVLGVTRSDEARKRRSAASKVYWSDPAKRARLSEMSKAQAAAPGERERRSERSKAAWNPVKRAEHSERVKARSADPVYHADHVNRLKAMHADPANRAKISKRLKELWQDPEYRARMIATNNAHGRPKEYRLITPTGELITIFNLEKFAIDNGLKPAALRRVVAGIRKSHKGWRVP